MIIKAYDILEGIQRTLAMLDADEAPESQGYLESLMIDEELTENDPYEIASTLRECDRPEPLPEALREARRGGRTAQGRQNDGKGIPQGGVCRRNFFKIKKGAPVCKRKFQCGRFTRRTR